MSSVGSGGPDFELFFMLLYLLILYIFFYRLIVSVCGLLGSLIYKKSYYENLNLQSN